MIHAGDTIENPVTGERILFRETSAETDGEAVRIECVVEPSGFVAKAHVHPAQTELFEILEGTVTFRLDGQELDAGPGDRVLVPAGKRHQFWNATAESARFRCEIEPALGFEQLIETMFSLAQAGKTNRKGMPNPLRLAVIARAHFDTVRLPFPPAWIQRIGLALGAPLGRLAGYRSTFEPSADARRRDVAPA
jgi:mannose-6-phosphate isomerase-like protein (cupin superfamily)